MEVLEIHHDKDANKHFIAPMTAANNGKYLVECDTLADANETLKAMKSHNPLDPETPLSAPQRFKQVSTHINGKTIIYKRI